MKTKQNIHLTLNQEEREKVDFIKNKLGFRQSTKALKWVVTNQYLSLVKEDN